MFVTLTTKNKLGLSTELFHNHVLLIRLLATGPDATPRFFSWIMNTGLKGGIAGSLLYMDTGAQAIGEGFASTIWAK